MEVIHINSTFDLLKNGEKEIKLSDKYKDIVLILGNTGAGKTTFTQWIAGDNDQLIAKEVAEGTGEYLIEDNNNRIGNSTVKSKTIFPELVIDTKTDTAYYDCPGFSDTRSTSNDIATAYFIKKVMDHASRVKMIFIINHSSVRKGVDRQDFVKLMRHATDLVKDIAKFQNSVAIVATKVDNQYVRQGASFNLVEDSKVIGAIADFLQEVREDLGGRVKLPDISVKEHKFYSSAQKFIDVLLVKEDNNYSKIGIFRRPDQPGPLSNITLLREGKVHVENILNERLNFTEKVNGDFGYTISEKSKNDINYLVEEINKSIWSNINDIALNIDEYYRDLLAKMRDRIKSFVSGTSVVDVDRTEAEDFSSKFKNNIKSILVEEIKNVTNPEELAEKVNGTITSLGIDVSKENILDIANGGKYFNFFQIVSDRELSTRPWAEVFEGKLPNFSELKNTIDSDVNDTAGKINNRLNDTVKALHGHFSQKMKLIEISKLPAELKKDEDVMCNIARQIEDSVTTNEALKILKTMQTIYESINRLSIRITRNTILIITNREKYLNYLKIISDKDLTTGTFTWICPFKDAVKYLDNSVKWYKFLNSLYSKFSEYVIQKDKNNYNVNNLEDWGKSEKPQGIEINKNNFELFLNITADYSLEEHNNIKNISVTELQLEELNHSINLTLKHRMTISCTEPYISIRGNYISIKEIIPNIIKNMGTDHSCRDILKLLKSKKIKFVNVFALNTVFVDGDVGLDGFLPISVIAPKWEVIGTRNIELNGVEGESRYNSTSQVNDFFTIRIIHGRSKAKDGVYPGEKGTDGKPGGAGGPGGTFFGIGDQFIGGANLTISANGGKGGAGEHGGDGARGKEEQSAQLPSADVSCRGHRCDNNAKINGFSCSLVSFKEGGHVGPFNIYKYKLFGIPGGKGGTGGNGGRGGKGGLPGTIQLFELSDYSGISRINNPGKVGEDGLGGQGGVGSRNYYFGIIATCIEYGLFTVQNEWHLEEIISNSNKNSSVNYGINGIDGANIKDMEDPEAGPGLNQLEKSKIINEYKSYLRENLKDRFTKFPLTQFLNKLNSDKNIKNVYNTLGLLDELQGLEEQFYKLNAEIPFVPFYQSLLDRISEYAQNPKEVTNSNQYKKVLCYLYTSILGRVYNLQDNLESNLIVNIASYLNSVQEDTKKLKELKKSKNKVNIINKYKEKYKNEIDIKIKEAQDLISKEIIPQIQNIGNEIDSKIDSLINEVLALQEQTKIDENYLKEKKKQLQNALALQSLFVPFKILGQVVSFLGPVGQVAGMAIGVGTYVAESFVLDDKTTTLQLPISVSDIEVLQNRIKTIGDQKVIRLKKTLADIAQVINEHPDKLEGLSVKIANIKDRINKIDGNRFNFKEIKALENELKLALPAQEEELRKTHDVITDKNTKNALAVLESCKKAVQLATVMFDIYSTYKNNQAKLDALDKAINSKENKFQELKEYEEMIYNTISPILQNIKNDLDDIASKLGTKSKVALDITKWQVQSTLGDIELQIRQLTREFEAKDNLGHCIIGLKDGMTTLINVYNHIQEYQEQQKFANYIADIGSVTSDDISLMFGEELGKAVRDLDITIQSNIIVRRQQVAIDAFKQFVFPFAHTYLKKFELPSSLELGANDTALENLVFKSALQIEEIKSKLTQYNETLTEHDGPIGDGEFSSHYDSTQPFFVWKNELHKNTISKLLSGEEVVLKADIMNSSPGEDAIKFNRIDFNLISNNFTTQSLINNMLKGFNISMTHLGNSYYRYNDKIYPFTTNSLVIWYHFEKKGNGEPVRKSRSYDKLKNGDFMLSPYALWKIKLINTRNRHNISFKDLETYKDEIDLELGGYGYFVNKGGVTEDLMVERYYKGIDTQNILDVSNANWIFSSVSLIQVGHSTRNKREINRIIKDERIKTTLYEKYQITPLSQESTEYEKNSNSKFSDWFSWLQLPSFNILPGAEAVVIKDDDLVSQKKHESLSLNDITAPFIYGIKLLKDAVVSKLSKPSDYTSNSCSSAKISNKNTDYFTRKYNADSSIYPVIGFHGNKNAIQAIASVDINGNLTLGQLVVHKMFGSNKCLSNSDYLSPEQERRMKINKLASEVLPILNDHFDNGYERDYYSAPQWYQEMYKEEFEEMVRKGDEECE